jgi:predicted nucleic acid-binding protein
MTVVDNNILSALAKIEHLRLLPDLFDAIGTPVAVVDELNRAEAAGYEFVDQIDAAKSYNGGWLEIISPTEAELQVADEIRDHALSTTDARCLAVASERDRRLLTDDGHVGTVGQQRGVTVWDLVLLLDAAVRFGCIESSDELSQVLDELRREDGYRFASEDEQHLFGLFES